MKTEIRNYAAEIRADAKGNTIQGTAVVYGKPSNELYSPKIGAFTEVIKAGALSASLASNDEIKADLNHETDKVIGRRSKGTLILNDTPTGLNVRIMPPATSWGNDALEAVRSGTYDGMSFEFNPNEGGERFYRDSTGKTVREISSLSLKRVSIVAEPAYPQTSVELRSESLSQAEKDLGESVYNFRNMVAAVAASII